MRRTLFQVLRTKLKLFLGRGVDRSYSQFGEDMIVKSLLRGVKNGFYVDVGCADPVLYSTTYHFYKKGWSGICIDPNPSLSGRYALIRPRDQFVCTGVGASNTLTYYAFNDETYNTFSEDERNEYLKRSSVKLISKTKVSVLPLGQILWGLTHIDYMNIDVQGLDIEVLETHDWNIKPTVISVEDENFNIEKPQESKVYQLLKSKGYSLKGICGLTLIFKE